MNNDQVKIVLKQFEIDCLVINWCNKFYKVLVQLKKSNILKLLSKLGNKCFKKLKLCFLQLVFKLTIKKLTVQLLP